MNLDSVITGDRELQDTTNNEKSATITVIPIEVDPCTMKVGYAAWSE